MCRINHRVSFVVICLALACFTTSGSAAVFTTWIGPLTGGNWNVASNWDTGVVPNNNTESVVIDGAYVTVNGSFTISSLSLDAAATTRIYNGKTLTLCTQASNYGVIRLDDVGTGTAYLKTNGNVTLGGSGKVLFTSNGANHVTYTTNTDVLTVGANQTIVTDGAGTSGEVRVGVINNGTIDADGGTLTLSIRDKTNNALFRSRNGGNLIVGAAITNTTGTITVDAGTGGTAEFNSNAEVIGGTIGGGGVINVGAGTASVAAVLDGVTMNAAVNIANGKYLKLKNTVTNNGTITLNDAGNYDAHLNTDGDVTLDGSGKVLFASGGANHFSYTNIANVLTVGANQTIATSGAGTKGEVRVNVINNGTIDADEGTLTLNTRDKTNNALFRSRNGGNLIVGVAITNTAGTITVDGGTGGTAEFNSNAEIIGGMIGGGGTINIGANTAAAAVLLDGVTMNAAVNIANQKYLKLKNTVTNNGTITLNDAGSYDAHLDTDGDVTLAGTGKVLFASNDANTISYTNVANVLTIGTNQTIATSGAGTNGEVRVAAVNNGTIDADGGTLTLSTYAKTNNGLFRSRNGGNLIVGVAITNPGTITVDGGSTMTLNSNAEIIGGTVGGGGTVDISANVASTAAVLDGLTMNAAVNIGQQKYLKLKNTVTNNGTITLNDAGTYDAHLNTDGDVTLAGTGKVLFASSGVNTISYTNTANVLTIGTNQTIATNGAGTLGEVRVAAVNNGTIDADEGTLALTTYAKTNNGLLCSRNSGNLVVGVAITNTSGMITVDKGSTMTLDDNAEIIGGTIDGGGTVDISANVASTAALLDGLYVNAAVNIGQQKYLKLKNTVTNDGIIALNDAGTYDAHLNTDGDVTLAGTGRVQFASNGVNTISYTYTSDVLTVGANQAISASTGHDGEIKVNLINQGTVNADGIIDFTSGRTFTNAVGGTISGSGRIDLNGVTFVNNGRIAPGNSPGILTIDGDVPFSSSAELFIEIAGTLQGDEYDHLIVIGEADLGGTLDVALLGFTPNAADTFVILSATSVIGTFDNAPDKLHFAQGTFDVTYGTSEVILSNYVPEPATMTLLTLGGLMLLRRKRK